VPSNDEICSEKSGAHGCVGPGAWSAPEHHAGTFILSFTLAIGFTTIQRLDSRCSFPFDCFFFDLKSITVTEPPLNPRDWTESSALLLIWPWALRPWRTTKMSSPSHAKWSAALFLLMLLRHGRTITMRGHITWGFRVPKKEALCDASDIMPRAPTVPRARARGLGPVHSRVLLPPQESLSFRNVKKKNSRCEFLTDSLYLVSWAVAGWEEQRHVVGVGEGQAGAARGVPPHGPDVAAESERHAAPRGGHGGHPGAHGGRRGRRGPPAHLLAPRRRWAACGRRLLAD